MDRARFTLVLVLFEHKPIVGELEARGIRVHVLPEPRSAALAYRGSSLRRAVTKAANLWRIDGFRARALLPLLAREQSAIVYCSNGVVPSLPVVAAAALRGIPLICHFKGLTH